MKITNEVLKDLRARLIDEKERIWEICGHQLKWVRSNTIANDTFDVWEFGYDLDKPFHGHFITDVEEMIKFAYTDGHLDGRNSLRKDIHDLLNNKYD